MKRSILALIAIGISAAIGGVLAFNSRVNYVYVPSTLGPTGACTVLLIGYTAVDNGELPIIRTASSLPTTFGCRPISIYPDTVE